MLISSNLRDRVLKVGNPWDFSPSKELLDRVRAMPKPDRRIWAMEASTAWNIYTTAAGQIQSEPISRENPVRALFGWAADYDLTIPIEGVCQLLGTVSSVFCPTYLEISLGRKYRLVWQFETPVMVTGTEHAQAVWKELAKRSNAETILPGFDAASYKPAERWTNGGEWYHVSEAAVSSATVLGLAVVASKGVEAVSRDNSIPIAVIADAIAEKWPGKWQGQFEVNAVGVRFWDETADNSTGCQVKPDGMLCFTGRTPFVKWAELLGREWVDKQTVEALGRAGDGIFFDGKNYWQLIGDTWCKTQRQDVRLHLQTHGLSDRVPKGGTISDVDRVLHHVQTQNRVSGAAPIVNVLPGLTTIRGQRVLNTSNLSPVQPDPGVEFPWLRAFFDGFFARPELSPKEHFFAWLKRAYKSIREHRPAMGQAIFLCGPKHNGKTLVSLRVIAPLLGHRVANPYPYMVGETTFNEDLFEAFLWALNDEEAPTSEGVRAKFLSRLKGFVVNPTHTYHPKFCERLAVDWTGRFVATLNDDAASVGLLPEISGNTKDKMMFFASKDFEGSWSENHEIEAVIARELPGFAAWLLGWEPPTHVLERSRVGVVSYFDPVLLELSHQQAYAYNLRELLVSWLGTSAYWADETVQTWEGTPTDLLAQLSTCEGLLAIVRDWKVFSVAKSLTTLAKVPTSGVSHVIGVDRTFCINRSILTSHHAQ